MPIFNRKKYIFKWLMFHCHVSFPGGLYIHIYIYVYILYNIYIYTSSTNRPPKRMKNKKSYEFSTHVEILMFTLKNPDSRENWVIDEFELKDLLRLVNLVGCFFKNNNYILKYIIMGFSHSFNAANSIATHGVLRPFWRFGTAIFVVLITFWLSFFAAIYLCCRFFFAIWFYLRRSSCFFRVWVGRHVATSKLAMACL